MEHVKHTPGPWRIGIRQPNSDKFIYDANGGEVANCDRITNFEADNLANARLIAQTPNLLVALVNAEAMLSAIYASGTIPPPAPGGSVPTITEARAAIAAAINH